MPARRPGPRGAVRRVGRPVRTDAHRRVLASQPARVRCCPFHGLAMSGGPVLWHCPAGRAGHRVTVTDLETAAGAGKDAA